MSVPALVRRGLAASVVLVAALALAAPAAAHTALVSSSPADGDTVTELTEVSLEFTEQLLDIGNELVMVAPDGTPTELEIGEVTETVTAEVPEGAIAPGENTLRFRVVSADGHPIEGSIAFTYAPDEHTPSPAPVVTVTATATPASSPSASATPAPSSPTPSATPDAVAATSGVPGWGWILGGAGAIAAVATTVILMRGRGAGRG
ncbi:copper resistance CopC family protein [Demequina lignilytica]|uniref:Copper resistance protein CopC n=1 Tax=Demequina lignilytica TaxID=3051663 RepID=A0AB35MF72_9MICO|nr:copper resistance protein CopC [Demequina sp. SYSU T0a273]MDN4482428.1 copper resistance protein CopC [Demequina sp. SYSU T0a273]